MSNIIPSVWLWNIMKLFFYNNNNNRKTTNCLWILYVILKICDNGVWLVIHIFWAKKRFRQWTQSNKCVLLRYFQYKFTFCIKIKMSFKLTFLIKIFYFHKVKNIMQWFICLCQMKQCYFSLKCFLHLIWNLLSWNVIPSIKYL